MHLAPIGITVYTRFNHFKKTIEALQRNTIAKQSDLYIYSDAASSEEDQPEVAKVRNYANSITGFRRVHVIERKNNYGGLENGNIAIAGLAKMFGSCIFLEDDIETAPGFLSFMNEAIAFYYDDTRVLSISGYCPPINIPNDLETDCFVMARFCGWGCGVFKRTIEALDTKIDPEEFNGINDKSILATCGQDVLRMIDKEVSGELDAADVRCMYRQALNEQYTIYPMKSLVQNIGHDGSGVHCGVTDRFNHKNLWDKKENFDFGSELKMDKRIRQANNEFRK